MKLINVYKENKQIVKPVKNTCKYYINTNIDDNVIDTNTDEDNNEKLYSTN